MAATVGTQAEQTVHRDPPPPPTADKVIDAPATAQTCQDDYAAANKQAPR
jgi:hypothetical protein